MNRFQHHLSAINQQKTHVTIPSMKHRLLILATALLLAFTRALGHGGVELGPNGGRILEFSKDETLHGEVLLKDGQFTVTLLDKDLKPVELKDQSLAVMGGSRSNPEKPAVTKANGRFAFPALKGDEYELVLRFKESPNAKAITARFTYDAATCSACKNPEWLCKCPSEKESSPARK